MLAGAVIEALMLVGYRGGQEVTGGLRFFWSIPMSWGPIVCKNCNTSWSPAGGIQVTISLEKSATLYTKMVSLH